MRTDEAQLDVLAIKQAVAEMFPPGVKFGSELMGLPVLHWKLRDWLDSKGSNIVQNISKKIIMTIAISLYDEAEDREVAENIVSNIINRQRMRS